MKKLLVLRNDTVLLLKLLFGIFMGLCFSLALLCFSVSLLYEVFFKIHYAYLLPALLLVPTSVYSLGLTFMAGYYLWDGKKAKKLDYSLFYPSNLDERLEAMPITICICRTIFLLALIQFIYGIMNNARIEDEDNPVLVVSIVVGFGSGMAWMMTSLMNYLDKRAKKRGDKYSVLEKAARQNPSLYLILWKCLEYPYKTLFSQLKGKNKGHKRVR